MGVDNNFSLNGGKIEIIQDKTFDVTDVTDPKPGLKENSN